MKDPLLEEAKLAPTRPARSKLEPYHEAIAELRRKHWTFRQIAQWLNERGISVRDSTIVRFFKRRQKRSHSEKDNNRSISANTPKPLNLTRTKGPLYNQEAE